MKRVFLFSMMFVILATTFSVSSTIISYADNENLSSKSAVLIDFNSGKTLFEKDADKHLPIASMVKMMTILLTLDEMDKGNIKEDTLITTSERASSMGGSQVFIDPYEEYRADDLLKSVIMASANDASVALAEFISGSEESFVDKMNTKAKEIGMKNTHYVNSTGLPAPEQYSCARDCGIVLKEVSKYPIYHKYSTIWMDELKHPSGRVTGLVNTNRLIRYYDGCDGGKTGSTNEAGCCLSATAKRNNMRLISVIVGAPNSQTRFNECSKLFNYGFANFENKLILDSSKELFSMKVLKAKQKEINVYAEKDFSMISKKGEKSEYDVSYDYNKKASAPMDKNYVIGKAYISKNGQKITEINLIIKDDVERISFVDCFNKVAENW